MASHLVDVTDVTPAGADCFSGHGLLERGLDPHKGTLALSALCRPRPLPMIPSPKSTPWPGLVAIGAK